LNNNVSSNKADGLRMEMSTNNYILENDVFLNKYGLFLFGSSSNNLIRGNNISLNPDYGISLSSSSHNDIIENNITSNNETGIYIFKSTNNNLTSNNISNNRYSGIFLYQSLNNTIKNNNVSGSGFGITLQTSSDKNVVNSNTVFNNSDGIGLSSSSNNTVSRNDVFLNIDNGLEISVSSYNSFNLNNVSNNNQGLSLLQSSNNTVKSNNLTFNNFIGIKLLQASNNTVFYNNVSNNDWKGIYIDSSFRNTVINNNISYNKGDGIYLRFSSNNDIINNTIMNNSNGIFLSGDSIYNNNVTFNRISGSLSGIRISNTLAPITTESAGHLIHNNAVFENTKGIWLSVGDAGKIENVGIISCSIYENDIGIFLQNQGSYVKNTTITKCNIYSNRIGIQLFQIDIQNEIANNNISYNDEYAIYLENSDYTFIHHNNFIKNNAGSVQAYDDSDSNIWNDSYPSGGNFWSDYHGLDRFKGPAQNIPGNDGIGDSPYEIDLDSQDNYPLMFPIGHSMFLYQGWNLVSIPFIQSDTNLGVVLSPISASFDAVQWYNTTDDYDHWKHNSTSKPPHLNDLDALDHTMGFWIHINEPGGVLFEYSGEEPKQNQNISLYIGWNMVGYPSLTSYNRTDGLNNLNFSADVDAIWSFNAAAQKWEYIRDIDSFFNRKGYYLHSMVNETWEVSL
jgi:parallel beta-helix repeat protein